MGELKKVFNTSSTVVLEKDEDLFVCCKRGSEMIRPDGGTCTSVAKTQISSTTTTGDGESRICRAGTWIASTSAIVFGI
jgi:hypothetical protein